MSIKIERLEHKFTECISAILKEEVKDKRVNFVTITSTSITNDLSFAKVYITVLDDTKRDEIIKVLNNASKFIERELCQRVEIRKMPELKFVYDESIEYSNNIENIIERLHHNE